MAYLQPTRYSFMNEDVLVDPRDQGVVSTVPKRYTQDPINPATGQIQQGQVLGASIVAPPTSAMANTSDIARRNLPPPANTPATPSFMNFEQFTKEQGGGVDEASIRENTRKSMQAAIDATNSYYSDLVGRENREGDARLDKVRAINVNSGLGGSNFATSNDLQQRDLNKGAVRAIENEKNMKLQEVFGKIDQIAREEIKAKKEEAKGNAEAYSSYLTNLQTTAREDLKGIAASGLSLDDLDDNRRKYLLERAGFDDPIIGQLYFDSLKPVQEWTTKIENGYIISSRTDPKTGKAEIQTTALPNGGQVKGDLKFAPDGTGFIVPDSFDPSRPLDEQITVIGNYGKPSSSTSSGGGAGGYTQGANPTVDAYVNGIRNGTYKPSDVPAAFKNAVAAGLNQVTPEMRNQELEKAQNLKASLGKLKASNSLGAAVGPLSSRLPTLRGGTADFEAYFNNVKSLLTLENLGLMKGVLSDKDIQILKDAATPLSLNMSEAGFKSSLESIEKTVDAAIKRAQTSAPSQSGGGESDPLGLFK